MTAEGWSFMRSAGMQLFRLASCPSIWMSWGNWVVRGLEALSLPQSSAASFDAKPVVLSVIATTA